MVSPERIRSAYAAFDGFADSNLGLVSVTVGDPATAATLDSDGDQWPDLVEYALGFTIGYPNAPLAQAMDFRDLGGTRYWTMSIPRAPAPGDVAAACRFQFGSDPLGSRSERHRHAVPAGSAGSFPASGQPKRFTRIRANR